MTRRRAWVLGLLVFLAILGGAVSYLFMADLGRFRAQIQAMVSDRLGLEVTVSQSLEIHLGSQLRIQALGLSVANPEWPDHPELLGIDRLDLSLRLWSLVRGPLEVTSLEAGGVRVWLETGADGTSNLVLPAPRTTAKPSPGANLPLLRHLSLQDFELTLLHPARTEPLRIELDSLTQALQAEGSIELQATGHINDRVLKYQGSVANIESVLRGSDIVFKGSGQLGTVTFVGEGRMDDIRAPRYPEFDLTLSGDDFEPVAKLLGRTVPGHGPFEIQAVTERAGNRLQMTVDGDIGRFALDATGHAVSIRDYSVAAFDVTATGPDLGQITRFAGLGDWPQDPFRFEGHISRDHSHVIIDATQLTVGDTEFSLQADLPSFPDWRQGGGSLSISGPDIAAFRRLVGFEGQAEGAFHARAALVIQADGSRALDAALHTSLLDLELKGHPGAEPGLVGARFVGKATGPDASILLRGYGIPGFAETPFELDVATVLGKGSAQLEPGTRLRMGQDSLAVSGALGLPPLDGGTRLALHIKGADLSRYAPVLKNFTALPGQPFDLQGVVVPTRAAMQLEKVRGTIGDNRIGIDGQVSLERGRRGTRLSLSAQGPNLETLVADTPAFNVPANDFDLSGDLDFRTDALKISQFEGRIGALKGSAKIELALPLATSSGTFDLRLAGPDPNEIWPETWSFQPQAQGFELAVSGKAAKGVWTFDHAQLDFGDARANLSGQLDHFPDFSATDMNVRIDVPDAAQLGTIKGVAPVPGVLSLSARLDGTRQRFRVAELVLQDGHSDLSGSMAFDFEAEPPSVEWRSHSRVLDFSRREERQEKQRERADEAPVEAAAPTSGQGSSGSGGLPFPDWPLPLDALKKFNAEIGVTVDTMHFPLRNYDNVVFDLTLKAGALRLKQFRGEGLRGYIDGSFSLVPTPDGAADLALDVSADGLVLDLSRERSGASEDLPVIEYAIHTTGHGRSLHQVAASLNGTAYATASPGIIPNSLLSAIDASLLEQLFNAILPGRVTEPTTRLECMAARLDIENGLVKTAPGIALVTDKVQMVSAGEIDLATGKLDLSFENHPNRRYQTNVTELLVNPFVKISGTLAKPKMTLDAPKALVYSGIAWGTGGLSILAKNLWDRLRRTPNPCEGFVEEARTGIKN